MIPPVSDSGSRVVSGWQAGPDGRGTWEILVSCVVTLTLCVWSALHLNVPPETARLRHRFVERTKWVLYGIFAPEFVVAVAASQYHTARWLKREIEKDAEHRRRSHRVGPTEDIREDDVVKKPVLERTRSMARQRPKRSNDAGTKEQRKATGELGWELDHERTWDITRCYFAAMGGFVAILDLPGTTGQPPDDNGDIDPARSFSSRRRATVTAEGIRLLSLLDQLPNITTKEVEDKSKADSLAKTIVVAQAIWMLVQVLGRVAAHLPVSLLEINTCGHVICALVLYLLWWNKPLDIHDPAVLWGGGGGGGGDSGTGNEDVLALMYVCSDVGTEGRVNPIRCFTYCPSRDGRQQNMQQQEQPHPAASDKQGVVMPALQKAKKLDVPWTTKFSVGSRGAQNWARFLGYREGEQHEDVEMGSYQIRYRASGLEISPECKAAYFRSEYEGLSLQHCREYCRRALADENDRKELGPLSPIPPGLLELASHAADRLWDTCMARTEYIPYYFTQVYHWGTIQFLGETDYLAWRIRNRPPMWNLKLGQVNIHRHALPAVFCLTAATYGGLHCSAWAQDYFPTVAEKILWVAAAMAIGWSGLCMVLVLLVQRAVSSLARRERPAISRSMKPWWEGSVLAKAAWWVALGLFVLARLYIVLEAFLSLRQAPEALYQTVEWTEWFPHM